MFKSRYLFQRLSREQTRPRKLVIVNVINWECREKSENLLKKKKEKKVLAY